MKVKIMNDSKKLNKTKFFSFRRVKSLMTKEFLQFFRNIPLVLIVFYMIVIDPWSASELSLDLVNYPFATLDLDKTSTSIEFIEKLRAPHFLHMTDLSSFDESEELLMSGEVGMVLVIPEDFQRQIGARKPAKLQVLFDGTQANSATIAIGYLAGIVEQFSEEIILEKWNMSVDEARRLPLINTNTRVLFNENLNDKWFNGAIEFLTALTLVSILLPAAATVYEKQRGTLEQLIVTPLKTFEVMIAKIVPMTVVIMACAYIGIYGILQGVVGMPVRGNIVYFTFITLVYLLTTTGIGLLISTIANNLAETVLITIIVLIPMVFLSGSWTPPETMPQWLQGLIIFSPMKYYLEMCLGVFFRGVGIGETWPSLLILAAISTAAFTLGALRFRKSYA